MSLEICNLSITAGKELEIIGFPKADARSFSINLGHNDQNLALHFNPRFCHLGDKNIIVFNSLQCGQWGKEKKENIFPFSATNEFKLTISFTSELFKIQLPGGGCVSFPNRFAEDKFKYIKVDGDVRITGILIK
ncbi:beta-galactoside-binding lectin-like [Arapaima gigas]